MEIELERLSIMLMDPTLTDQQFKEEILFLKEFPVRSILCCPMLSQEQNNYWWEQRFR